MSEIPSAPNRAQLLASTISVFGAANAHWQAGVVRRMKQHRPSRSGHSLLGPMFAVFLVLLVLMSSWLFIQRRWWLPELASVHGVDIDRVFTVTLIITGILFVVLQLVLAFFSVRYREQ